MQDNEIELKNYAVREHTFTAHVRPFGHLVRVDVRRNDEPEPFLSTVGMNRQEAMTRTNCALVGGRHLPPSYPPSRLRIIEDALAAPRYRADRRSVADVADDRCRGTTFAGR